MRGEYCLSADDVREMRKFEDPACRACWPIEYWDAERGVSLEYLPEGDYYEIPYRCLVPGVPDNLLVGSRCISSTHEAHSSLRVMPVVAGIGEAAGIAAAMAVAKRCAPREVSGAKLKELVLGPA